MVRSSGSLYESKWFFVVVHGVLLMKILSLRPKPKQFLTRNACKCKFCAYLAFSTNMFGCAVLYCVVLFES